MMAISNKIFLKIKVLSRFVDGKMLGDGFLVKMTVFEKTVEGWLEFQNWQKSKPLTLLYCMIKAFFSICSRLAGFASYCSKYISGGG